MSEWIVLILLLIGGCFILIGLIGLVKMLDFFMCLYGLIKVIILGMVLLFIVVMVYFSYYYDGVSVKEILILIFLLIIVFISGYMLIKLVIYYKFCVKEGIKGLDNVEDD